MRVLPMKFGSLFSGIGGLDLGLERAGLTCQWQSEIDPYASRVLKKHWPAIPNLGDINDIEWEQVEPVDLVCGGYPCQPFSYAGSRNGTNDPRHLWPRFADCLRILRPRFALLENVPGHFSLGFGAVQADLAALGYNTEWDCIPAAAIGAPHMRDRVFIIAMDTNSNSKLQRAFNESPKRQRWLQQPRMGRVADGFPHRMDRLKGLGNAVVPQVAEHIGKLIMDMAT